MNLTDEKTLPTAIDRYAVLLNRPAWLDEGRRKVQLDTWGSLVRRYGDGQPGQLAVTDFEDAIVVALRGGGGVAPRAHQDILPSTVVQDACGYAAARHATVLQLLAMPTDMVLYSEVETLRRLIEIAGDDSDGLAGAKGAEGLGAALARFQAAADAKADLLRFSGCDKARVVVVVDWILERRAEVTAKVEAKIDTARAVAPATIVGA